MQTILGSGGAIANVLAKELLAYTKDIQLVSRNPVKVNETDTLLALDLCDKQDVIKALEGSEVAYLTVGLTYDLKTWQAKWPVIMQNTIEACLANNCRLVFFDNIYMYDGNDLSNMTESMPLNPPSEKGKIRKQIVDALFDAVNHKGLKALVARSADFYGPGIKQTSMLTETVVKPLSTGSTANWLMGDGYKHAFTYTLDAGKACAILGNSTDAYGEVWHLPTATNPPTGKQWVEAFASQLNAKPKYRVVGKGFVRFLGLFIPAMRESVEMLYQYNRDYVFNSQKFDSKYNFKPTPYLDGIKHIVDADYKK